MSVAGGEQLKGPARAQLLLVDDDGQNLQVLYDTLSDRDYRLLVARSGADALDIARRVRPDLVLLDILMPEMDGYQVCRHLKADPATAAAPVIFLSALTDTKDKVLGLQLGAVDFISKPFQPEEVIARVNTHLKIRRLEQELAGRNRELEAANRHILGSMEEGLYGLDASGAIIFANAAAERITGWREQELLGRTLYEVHSADRAAGTVAPVLAGTLASTLTNGLVHHREDELFRHREGGVFPVEFTSSPLYQDDALSGAVVVFKDITERKRQEKELRNALREVRELKDRLEAENIYLQAEIRTERNFGEIVGQSSALLDVLQQVRQVAPTDSSVLIQGESGTGKEAVARALHGLSYRKGRPLIKVNCGAISANLVESELFGHVKGSFTGALRDRAGHFELADGGTMFLDEVSELPADAQVKLLRVLQEQEIQRVGSSEVKRVDVRIIAATNRELMQCVNEGTFRMDLYYRLNVFPLIVPPLRQRKSDVPLLVNAFLQNLALKLNKPLEAVSRRGMELLMRYDWPGNIRELQNVLERAAILARRPVVDISDALIPLEPQPPSRPDRSGEVQGRTLADCERRHIRQVLDEVDWVVGGKRGAAEILGVPSSTLRSRMKKLGIRRS